MVRELSHLTKSAEPTVFHHMLATLAAENRLLRLYSQNVDGIDTRMTPLSTNTPLNAKGPWPRTIQLHGGLDKMVCSRCGQLEAFAGSLFEGPDPPPCNACAEEDIARTQFANKRSRGIGRMRPRMVLYNEHNPDDEAIGAVASADLRTRPDAVIVVGTSLKVPGVRRIAREMCAVARGRRDGFTAWINNEPEPVGPEFKDCWDIVVRGDCDEVARHVGLPKWDDRSSGAYSEVTDEQVKQAKQAGGVEVRVTVPRGILTPAGTPKHQSPAPLKGMAKLKQPQLGVRRPPATSSVQNSKGAAKSATTKKGPRKPQGRKPAPKGNARLNFAVTKGTLEVAGGKAEASKPLFPGLSPAKPSQAMRPVSPSAICNNTSLTSSKCEIPAASLYSKPQHQFSPEIPDTPPSEYGQTIVSSDSKPHNMAHLLN